MNIYSPELERDVKHLRELVQALQLENRTLRETMEQLQDQIKDLEAELDNQTSKSEAIKGLVNNQLKITSEIIRVGLS